MPQIAMICICCGSQIQDKQPAVLMSFVAKRALDWEPCEITAEWGLRDLCPGHAYALGNISHCQACGRVFLDMRFDDAEITAPLYQGYRGEAYTPLPQQARLLGRCRLGVVKESLIELEGGGCQMALVARRLS